MKLCDAAKVDDRRRQNISEGIMHTSHKENDKKLKKRQSKAAAFENAMTNVLPSSAALKGQFSSKIAKKQTKKKVENKPKQPSATPELLRPESVKSRNHKLVLAPSTSKPSTFSSGVSTNFPRWGIKLKRYETTQPLTIITDRTVTDALHEEILAYTKYTKKTVEKMAVHIEEMIENVRMCVQSLWSQSRVETFGSYSTGIWLPSSDVDLVILNVVELKDNSALLATHLKELAKVLETKDWVESLVVLETAKVPVLKLVSAGSSVPIDITFESTATHSGLLARDLIKQYADMMPELYPLAIVFKQLLRERDLNDAYTGGLSSYSVVLMLIHFLQLWKNGDVCFLAASIYASGSLPPSPSILAAKTQALKAERRQNNNEDTQVKTTESTIDTSATSYAAVVTGSKQQVSDESGLQVASSTPRFSYAAVAAGIVKVSAKEKVVEAPSSYAAAVTTVNEQKSVPNVVSNPGKTAEKDAKRLLDSISVSSSNADTEDSSSSCSHVSCTDSDDESAKVVMSQPPISLGAYTMLILEFFGIIFDYHKNGLSVRDGGYIYRLADSNRAQVGKPVLVIEDPIYPDRNVSASSFAFYKVVALFEDSYYALKYFRASKFTPSALSCLLSASGHSSHTSLNHSKVPTARS